MVAVSVAAIGTTTGTRYHNPDRRYRNVANPAWLETPRLAPAGGLVGPRSGPVPATSPERESVGALCAASDARATAAPATVIALTPDPR